MVRESVKDENAEILVVAAKTEADIAELETYEDRQMFLEEVGLEESGVSRLIKSAYSLLNLQTYFTAGYKKYVPGRMKKAGKLRNAPALSIQTLRKDSFALKLSSTKTSAIWQRSCCKRSRKAGRGRKRIHSAGWRYHALPV